MRVGLNPVVCWFTDDTEDSYEDSLTDLFRLYSHNADRLLAAQRVRTGCNAIALVYQALGSLQREILDQYLPEVEIEKRRAVGCVWPYWQELKVVTADKKLGVVPKLPTTDETEYDLDLGEDGRFPITFYRNDTRSQRHRWFLRVLKDEAKSEGRELPPLTNPNYRPEDTTKANALEDLIEQERLAEGARLLKKLRARLSPKDWEVLIAERPARGKPTANPEERKSRRRNRQNIRQAYSRALTRARTIAHSILFPQPADEPKH